MENYSALKLKPIISSNLKNNEGTVISLINQLKFILIVKTVFGINRLYLLQCRKVTLVLSKIYCFLYFCIIGYQFNTDLSRANLFALRNLPIIEYEIAVIVALTTFKNTFKSFFNKLHSFDKMLNIQNDVSITCPSRRILKWVLASLFFNFLELGFISYLGNSVEFNIFFVFVILSSHDLELVFFFTLFRCIRLRVLIIKAHVEKNYADSRNKNTVKANGVGKLSERAQLDTSSLHEAYELLIQCAETLNTAINLPVCQ